MHHRLIRRDATLTLYFKLRDNAQGDNNIK